MDPVRRRRIAAGIGPFSIGWRVPGRGRGSVVSGLPPLDFGYYFDKYGNMETMDALRALAALAQESRLATFRLLVETGPEGRVVGEIAQTLGIANATLSFHLKELANAGLIAARQEGRFIYYSANYSGMNELLAYLTENCCAGNMAGCAPAASIPAGSAKSPGSKPATGSQSMKRRAAAR